MKLLRPTVAVAILFACALLGPNEARACSYPACAYFVAPARGATDVPLETSVVIASETERSGLQLEKGGAVVWSGGEATSFADGHGCVRRYTLPTLEAGSTYVLTASTPDGGREELTSFTTSDQPPSTGTAPRITSLTVKFVEGELLQPTCFGCATADLASVEFEPASIPGTNPDSVLHAWTLRKEGEAEALAPGPTASVFTLGQDWLGCRGPYPCWLSPCASRSPGDRYCAKVKAWGLPYAPDQALESEEVCTTVVREGAVEPPDAGQDADAAVIGLVDAGNEVAADAGVGGEAPGETEDASGCSTAAGGTFVGLALLALGVVRRRA